MPTAPTNAMAATDANTAAVGVKVWPCEDCQTLPGREPRTYDYDALLRHKMESFDQPGKPHGSCHVCRMNFRTKDGFAQHHQTAHTFEQELECPGCKKTFRRAGTLMQHIEDLQCQGITARRMAEVRAKKVDFFSKLQLQQQQEERIHNRRIQTGPENAPGNFGRYLGVEGAPQARLPSFEVESGGVNLDKDADFPRAAVPAYRHGDSKQPDLLTEENLQRLSTLDIGGSRNIWSQKKDFFPEAPPAIKPSTEHVAALHEKPKVKQEALDPLDPDNPTFNVMNFVNKYTQKFTCPHPRCGKNFPTGKGMIAHLRSPAHSHVKMQCPQCLKYFTSGTALMQHVESQGNKCTIRDSEQYRQFVDQLTAGIADVDGRHADNTVRYVVNEKAVVPFLEGASEGVREALMSNAQRAALEAERKILQEKRDYWKNKNPTW